MVIVNILYESSCVGKSYIMKNRKGNYNKIEMDDYQYWALNELEWQIIVFYF